MSETHGVVHWTELMSRDLPEVLKYYSATCGWTYDTMPMQDGSGEYYIAKVADKPMAGLMSFPQTPDMADVPSHWLSYFAVDDVDAAVATTKASGGEVIRAPFDVPGIGRIAILKDPSGAAMGMMTPAQA